MVIFWFTLINIHIDTFMSLTHTHTCTHAHAHVQTRTCSYTHLWNALMHTHAQVHVHAPMHAHQRTSHTHTHRSPVTTLLAIANSNHTGWRGYHTFTSIVFVGKIRGSWFAGHWKHGFSSCYYRRWRSTEEHMLLKHGWFAIQCSRAFQSLRHII